MFFVIVILIGLIPAFIAQQKGRSFIGWWIYGSLLFIVALPHSLIAKRNNLGMENKLLNEGYRKCNYCAEMIKQEALICKHCGKNTY